MKELSPEEQERFLLEARKRSLNEAIILIFALETGVRLSEALSLSIEDVENKASFFVRTAKRKDHILREIPILPRLRVYLNAWIAAWRKAHIEHLNPEHKLFISRRRKPMGSRYVQHVCLEVMIAAGLTQQIWCEIELKKGKKVRQLRYHGPHFHSLRHSFSKNRLREGMSLPILQDILGHSSLDSTGVYLLHSREEKFKAMGIAL